MTGPTKPRARRIAADEAHAWARNLRLHNSLAKLVLSMTTLYVDGSGECWVSIPALAEDTELSPNTVRQRLAYLEEVGAIARFPQWVDDLGRRNSEERGRRTSDVIRLLLHADADAIEHRALNRKGGDGEAADPPHHGGSVNTNPAVDPPCGEGSADPKNLSGDSLSPSVALQLRGGPESLEPEPEDSPPTPLRGEGQGEPDHESEEEAEIESWQEFKTAFEGDGQPILKVSLCKTLFAGLTAGERATAITAAKGLIAVRSRNRKPGTKPAGQIFLREREAWASFAAQAPRPPERRRTVDRGSLEFYAADVFKLMIDHSVLTADKVDVSESLLSQPDFMALAAVALDRSTWVELHEDNPGHKAQIGAWRARMKAWSGRWIEFENIQQFGDDGRELVNVKEWNGQELRFKVTKKGLLVPRPWPPRVDGTWPDQKSASDDLNHLGKTG